jgi:hypothetical protein
MKKKFILIATLLVLVCVGVSVGTSTTQAHAFSPEQSETVLEEPSYSEELPYSEESVYYKNVNHSIELYDEALDRSFCRPLYIYFKRM